MEMSRGGIEATSTILVLGGSETTATLLSGTVYYLLLDPRVKQKLVTEIRINFRNEDEINMTNVSSLPYLPATLEEAMRIYPLIAMDPLRQLGKKAQ